MTQMRRQVILFSFCLTFVKVVFAQQNSDGGWKVGWTWDGGRSSRANVAGLSDEDMVAWLYTRPSRVDADHPSLYERMEFRKAYEVTENPAESDYSDDSPGTYQQETLLGTGPDHLGDDNSLGTVDNTLTVGRRPYSSSSSTYMSSSTGDVHRTEYSHQIIHSRKKRSANIKRRSSPKMH